MGDKPERKRRHCHFVVFSDDWGMHPSSCQHIFGHILVDHQVTWVNTIGMRNPRISMADARKVFQKLARMLSGKRQATTANSAENLTVVQPIMLPYMANPLVRRFNRWSVNRVLRKKAAEASSQPLVVVSTVPNSADYVDSLGADRVIYYCVDDFSEWPGLDRDFILGMESDLVGKADLILATSAGLRARLAKTGKPVTMLEHGVDIDHFSEHADVAHPLLRKIDQPRIGFFGLIDGRLDQDLLTFLAKSLPEFQFVFAGPSEVSVAALERLENVHFIGRLAYSDLPEFVAGMDVLVVPYKVDALAEALSPLKLKEYLATGLPVVSAAIPASLVFKDVVAIAHTREDWPLLIRDAQKTESSVRNRLVVSLLAGQSWRAKADQLLAVALKPA